MLQRKWVVLPSFASLLFGGASLAAGAIASDLVCLEEAGNNTALN